MSKYRLIIDLATERVVYFTEDLTQELFTDEKSVQAEYDGDLNGMTQANSWNYRYRNKALINTVVSKVKPISLLETNRDTIREFVIVKLNDAATKYVAKSAGSRYIEDKINLEAEQLVAGVISSSRWVALRATELNIENLHDAAIKILEQIKSCDDKLFKIATLKMLMLNRVKSAVTNDELFIIRDDLFKELKNV